jgi:hypothetical protein
VASIFSFFLFSQVVYFLEGGREGGREGGEADRQEALKEKCVRISCSDDRKVCWLIVCHRFWKPESSMTPDGQWGRLSFKGATMVVPLLTMGWRGEEE